MCGDDNASLPTDSIPGMVCDPHQKAVMYIAHRHPTPSTTTAEFNTNITYQNDDNNEQPIVTTAPTPKQQLGTRRLIWDPERDPVSSGRSHPRQEIPRND